MSSVFDGLEELKRRVAAAKAESDKIKGAIRQVKKERKARFGYSSLTKAKKILPKLEKRERQTALEYTEFYKKWIKENGKKIDKLLEQKK